MDSSLTARCMPPLLAVLVLTIGVASGASAQEAATDFTRVETLIRPGDTVLVSDTSGRETKWKLGNVPLQTLIQQAGLSVPEVAKVTVERHDSLWNGALIGLAVAGTPWLIVCAANDWCYYNEYGAENMYRTLAVVTAAAGAGIGALVDRSIQRQITIYRGPKQTRLDLGISPTASPSGAMVRLSARF